ncbi:hypothetical protein AAFC00_001832 [Neodothiora populina]
MDLPTTPTITPVRLSTSAHPERSNTSTPESEGSRSGTPALSLTPRTLLPRPPMLPEDSPTKYGLHRKGRTPSPDRTLTAAQRKKMTGPSLFAHSVLQLRAHCGLIGQVSRQQSFSRSTPCLLLNTEETGGFRNTLPARSARPLTGHSFHDFLSRAGNDVKSHYNVARALPIQPCQRECYRYHDAWHATAKPRHNVYNPVSCAVCHEYGAPSEGHDTAGDDFRRCDWCWLIVCGKCHEAFVSGGLSAMMSGQSGA